jgi:hypothetical protein
LKATFHVVNDVWQLSQPCDPVGMWFAILVVSLPVLIAVVPLWQSAQTGLTPE